MAADPLRGRNVPEDAVQYSLFLTKPSLTDAEDNERKLLHLKEQILTCFANLLVQYIWQKQPFSLKYQPETGSVPAHIGGCTEFGDNVEDEWFIVYLLQQITKTFPELTAKVGDNDGELLLIEAADYLPKWLNPDNSENRVFFCSGQLHIIPCPSRPGEVGWSRDKVPTISQALALLASDREACLASSKIRSALQKKLDGFPDKIQTGFHRAHCFLPAGIATVLAQRPDLLAPAVSAFYLRDPVDLQACRSFRTFLPETRVLTSVTFTRCLFAQLRQQTFKPDRRSGYSLPPCTQPQYQAHELGMKLAHGFEILCSECRTPSSEPDAPASCNPQWKSFLESLKKNDYFRGELEGSKQYKELMTSAENVFKQSFLCTPSSCVKSPGEEVLQILQSSPYDLEELKKQEKHLPPQDSDSWLELTPQDLEQILQRRAGCGASGDLGRGTGERSAAGGEEEAEQEASYSLVAVTEGMKNFINTMSSYEGAELPWFQANDPFSFDADSVTSALDKLLGAKDEELDSDDFEEEEEEEEAEEAFGFSAPQKQSGAEALDGLKSYMDQMDQELRGTNVGKSFTLPEKQEDKEANPSGAPKARPSTEQEGEEIQPLDVDLNLVTNLLESLASQAGLAGPASNLLQSMGFHLPANSDRP
ncbi:protein ecdysoneless homolog [Clupea harengus]|uniref:Protein ecdysoneless homolog n=1 Tax=Clupea harengus TaxID=7950 RepID=A0A8M1KEK2_CLUHA|nr:protein ecdysoneless homolog [Clupea harengus]